MSFSDGKGGGAFALARGTPGPLEDAAFAVIAEALRSASGLALAPDQHYLLAARLGPVLRRAGLPDLAAFAERLRLPDSVALLREAAEAMTTNETSFFRDETPFRQLAERVLPALAAARPPGTALRIWSAACSSGQEAYSAAMLAAEGSWRVEILGTDLSAAMVERASAGRFSQFEVRRGLSPARLARWFSAEGNGWRIDASLRAACRFQQANLLQGCEQLGRFDVIFLRNVLIYFDSPTKERVLENCARQLAPDGVLFLGSMETLLGLRSRLAPLPGCGGFGLARR